MYKEMSIHKIIIKIRKELHQIPEEGLKEFETSKYICDKLTEFGYLYEKTINTGIIACKKSEVENDEAIAFRADMDGLQMEEKTNINLKSKHIDYMHACGHDVHMANLLGLAYFLRNKKVNKDIVFIFQPAEEAPGGAKLIVETGILEKYHVKEIYGLHVWPYLTEGIIGIKPGPIMARCGEFELTIVGKGGHGATPHNTIDPILISSQFINTLQSIVSRNMEPIEGGVVTVGYIIGGSKHNIISDKIELGGTIRAFSDEVFDMIKKRILEICEGFEKTYNATMNIKLTDFYPAVINDEKLTNEFIKLISDEKIENIKPSMTGEDFSFYQKKIPGVFFFVGTKNEDKGCIYPLHNSKFNVSDEVTYKGFQIYKKLLMRKEILV